jgi:hypothetical protein
MLTEEMGVKATDSKVHEFLRGPTGAFFVPKEAPDASLNVITTLLACITVVPALTKNWSVSNVASGARTLNDAIFPAATSTDLVLG